MTTESLTGCRNDEEAVPIQRNLDGIYYRVKRGTRMTDVCFTDLTASEQENVLQEYGVNEMRRVALILARTLRQVGDDLNVFGQ